MRDTLFVRHSYVIQAGRERSTVGGGGYIFTGTPREFEEQVVSGAPMTSDSTLPVFSLFENTSKQSLQCPDFDWALFLAISQMGGYSRLGLRNKFPAPFPLLAALHIHIFVFTDCKNSRLQKKLLMQSTDI